MVRDGVLSCSRFGKKVIAGKRAAIPLACNTLTKAELALGEAEMDGFFGIIP